MSNEEVFGLMKKKVEQLLAEHKDGAFSVQEMEALAANRLPMSTDCVDYAVVGFWAVAIAILKDEETRQINEIEGSTYRTLKDFDK